MYLNIRLKKHKDTLLSAYVAMKQTLSMGGSTLKSAAQKRSLMRNFYSIQENLVGWEVGMLFDAKTKQVTHLPTSWSDQPVAYMQLSMEGLVKN